jgi:hypothetical protein
VSTGRLERDWPGWWLASSYRSSRAAGRSRQFQRWYACCPSANTCASTSHVAGNVRTTRCLNSVIDAGSATTGPVAHVCCCLVGTRALHDGHWTTGAVVLIQDILLEGVYWRVAHDPIEAGHQRPLVRCRSSPSPRSKPSPCHCVTQLPIPSPSPSPSDVSVAYRSFASCLPVVLLGRQPVLLPRTPLSDTHRPSSRVRHCGSFPERSATATPLLLFRLAPISSGLERSATFRSFLFIIGGCVARSF